MLLLPSEPLVAETKKSVGGGDTWLWAAITAALFERMDARFAAGFLARMRPEAGAGIMAGLSPEAAHAISVVLAGRNARTE